MAGNTRPTTFVSGSDGWLGRELVRLLVSLGHRVLALTPSIEGAESMRRLGATPVIGDPLIPGRWQDEAAAELIIHLPPTLAHRRFGARRGLRKAHARVSLDANLLDAVSSGLTRQIVYVADACCYGAAGARPVTEDEPPRPSAAGRPLVPALDRLNGYVLAGLPIVTAIPGCVYGDRGWFRALIAEPIETGRRVVQFGRTGPLVSPIHVRDCVRALVHLAGHGRPGGRYFVANNAPVRLSEFAATFARLAHRPLRLWRLPAAAARFVVGDAWPDYPRNDAVLSNIRLRATGFRFHHPTLEDGLEQVLRASHEQDSI